MKRAICAAVAIGTGASAAFAGGIERSALSTGILFEDGNYAEFSFGSVAPKVSGVTSSEVIPPLPPGTTGDVAGDYTLLSFGYKNNLTETLDLAIILDQPIGADVAYLDPSYPYGGLLPLTTTSTASIDSKAVTALLRYEFAENLSAIGGVRALQSNGVVSLFNGYTMSTTRETDLGYILGGAWERPDIAARVAVTYQSAIDHDFTVTEDSPALMGGGPIDGPMRTTIPQSLTVEFQTGVAADTLLFGSVKWAEWTAFDITPPIFAAGADDPADPSLVSYENDTVTWNLGLGRRFNEDWSAAILASYEETKGGFVGNLGPSDGFTSIGLAVTRTFGNVEITGGARYVWIGDANTESPDALSGTTADRTLGEFRDNSGVAFGLRVGVSF
ncbi:MAG: hypothetical protein QNJ35_07965 [Paracoccaceae bacterium]|nr:hypothetical protein [Paracoccaceae bacterium]